MFDIPIVLFIYNRPESTKVVLNEIINIQPRSLYIVADGPKSRDEDDLSLVNKTRCLVDDLLTNTNTNFKKVYSDTNIGFESRIVSGLNHVFDVEKWAIILEDDCVPSITFFSYCNELLLKYKDNYSIMHIAGSRYIDENLDDNYSYYFSNYPIVGAWATWSRAWQYYDPQMKNWPDVKSEIDFFSVFYSNRTKRYWLWMFNECYNRNIQSWGYKWIYANLKSHKLSIIPRVNLIKNIGIGGNASNTLRKNDYLSRENCNIEIPLLHPEKLEISIENDKSWERVFFSKSIWWLEIVTKRIKPAYKIIRSYFGRISKYLIKIK